MGRIIAVANQKGGVGKTTTTISLSASLAWAERKVLIIDIDPQANATSGVGIDPTRVVGTIYDVLIGRRSFREVVLKSDYDTLEIIPSTQDLTGAEIELVGFPRRERVLKERTDGFRDFYDYVFIDCPPSLGLLTVNALTAADSVIMPIQCEYYALEGLSHLMKTIERLRRNLNPSLMVEGILLTMCDMRTRLSVQVVEEVRRFFGERVFRTVIPRNIKLSEAPSFGKPIIHYDMRSKGAESYVKLAQEILESEEERRRAYESGGKRTESVESHEEQHIKVEEVIHDEKGPGSGIERPYSGDGNRQGA